MINGKTRVVAIVANPIAHVRTPQAFNALMQARGIDAVMLPFNVLPKDFPAFIAAAPTIQNLAGLVVTIPYKEAIFPHCSDVSAAARQSGAVNIVRFGPPDLHGVRSVSGDNLDGAGFVGGLLAQGHAVAGQRVYLAGAGGAAKAIAHALAGHGVAEIGIYNRSAQRAEQLAQDLRQHHPALSVHAADARPAGYALAINATSLGLNEDDPLPFSLDALASDTVVAEVVMKVELTPLLSAAQQRGLAVHFGRHMLGVQLERMGQFLGLL